ncbi:heme ABC exporter ATP-binding protein CcmA [Roseibium aggregatum]|uniref:Heme ABC exporter ATP-binding protein CcmA n=1 Tax=Roseibium aggregatum TaxID=187304 RepID=A0A939EKL0_9HYPH|nr:heme ABC exporter ATP-binding protein CcmA [Roseibium aggregatum]MBN9673390.1 heme ABC exporter ATP-binding protein CcmA [Roseibium aggregatum]
MKLIAENLTIDRGGRRVFQDLSFTLDQGTALVVTGANGIGKSSLLRTLAGLVSLAGGDIRLEGGQADRLPFEQTHYFGHQDAVKPALSVLENLTFWRSFSAATPADVFAGKTVAPLEALELLGIAHTAHLPAAYLSAGQKRRLSLSRLLVTPRPIWLMDEPTSALDKASEKQLLDLMNGHLASGGLIVTATHTDLALDTTSILHMRTPDPSEIAPQEMLS